MSKIIGVVAAKRDYRNNRTVAAPAAKEAKAPNYTADQVAQMTAEYTANSTKETVKTLATAFGKTEAAIRMKLVNLGIYKKAEYATKTGAAVQKKDETATAIGNILRLSEGDTDSLAKANKRALQAVFAALANSVPIDGKTPAPAAGTESDSE